MRISLLIYLLLLALGGRGQLKLSSAGAMTALNASALSSTPPSAPLNYLTATPVPAGPPSTIPISVAGQVNYQNFIPNDRTMTFAYQSALAWYSGYFNYVQAAQNLNFSGASYVDIAMALSGANYILSDGIFPQFQSYGSRKATMIIRANDQAPVHFPKVTLINNANVQFNTYTPTVSTYSVEVPLRF
jgi:hypothetical protein